MALTYSRFFKVKHKDFLQKGVYNAFLDQDSLLHIHIVDFRGSEIPEFTNAYTEFFNHFRLFIPLVKASKADNLQDHFFKKMVNRFTFKEIPNTGLGFSKGNTRGRGISGALSIQLAHSAYTIINAGLEDPEIFGLMQLIEDNMAADRISDMTIAILQKHFNSLMVDDTLFAQKEAVCIRTIESLRDEIIHNGSFDFHYALYHGLINDSV